MIHVDSFSSVFFACDELTVSSHGKCERVGLIGEKVISNVNRCSRKLNRMNGEASHECVEGHKQNKHGVRRIKKKKKEKAQQEKEKKRKKKNLIKFLGQCHRPEDASNFHCSLCFWRSHVSCESSYKGDRK